jgi:predicted cupin superfamily sugar epimerase
MLTVEQIIEALDMKPLLPEGGYVKVSYNSDLVIKKDHLPKRYAGDKPICGAILYLITGDTFSRMHSLPTDEIYHFYMGDGVEQLQLLEDGSGRIVRMGHNILKGELIQALAPAHCWQGTRLAEGGTFALLGTTMAPAYTDDDYSDGSRERLIQLYPRFEGEILART